MTTVFVGGSRHVARLNAQAKERLDNIIGGRLAIVVGDAPGADKAVQKHLVESGYDNVTVYCSGEHVRNNLGNWETRKISPSSRVKGFQFFAAKDREMALRADYGLMIWDGKSPGTALNVLRLVRAGKKAVLLNVSEKTAFEFKRTRDWLDFLSGCDQELVEGFRSRATPDEWMPPVDRHSNAGEPIPDGKGNEIAASLSVHDEGEGDPTAAINEALALGDVASVVEKLGTIARAHGMSDVAKESGLARESLYRALSLGGNPELSTVMKVMASLGLRLSVSEAAER
jgi:adenine-specific DNA-methyltransferase